MWHVKFRKHAACRQAGCQTEGLDLLLDFPQHLRPGLPPATGVRRGPKDSIQISQTDQTQTKTETETFLATVTHQEEPSRSVNTVITHGISHNDIRLIRKSATRLSRCLVIPAAWRNRKVFIQDFMYFMLMLIG